MPSWIKIGPVVLEKSKIGNKKRRTDRQMTGDQRSSLELSAQVSLKSEMDVQAKKVAYKFAHCTILLAEKKYFKN